jgi:GGDEF domain-containing protein
MDESLRGNLSRIPYSRVRQLVLAAGLTVLGITVAILLVRGVETSEVVATVLFIPIFIAFVFWGIRGGVVSAVLATIVYILVRQPAIDAVGAGRFSGLIFSRAIAYLAFGLIGGWANEQLEKSLNKLELYDQIDDSTGLYNARFFVQDADLELSRSKRYQTVFSLAIVDIPSAAIDALERRPRIRVLRELGRLLNDSIRTVDRAVHALDDRNHRFAVVLPETGPDGATIFTDRLADKVSDYLSQRGVQVTATNITRTSVTYPDDGDAAVQALRDQFAAIDRVEHPEASSTREGAR